MPTPVQIRRAEPGDFARVGAITVEAYVGDGHIPADADYTRHLADAVGRAADATLLVAADEQGELLGSVTYCAPGSPMRELAGDGEVEIRMLAVSAAARGRGVGEALVRACLDLARSQGHRAMVLSTQPTMLPAHGIYQRLGFTRVPEHDWSPVPGVELLAYRLAL